ncbi:MAG: hypothetical protein K2O29_07635 [Ruminococcus sp.]|nr:hypothetical protein [Ruminococcus sp.]MDE6848211.1 hypothetical protein [Ruminococcus sp.]MDE7138309.1 hypothetical protein [Ruminococcus sp.]
MMNPDMLGKTDNPEELADLIDKLMAQGSGHVNIAADTNGEGMKIDMVNSTDCGAKGACMQPTETSIDPDAED